MAPDIALRLVDSGNAGMTVLDPMCGSGTVLAAAISTGHNAIGFDIDPLAVLMTSVTTAPVDGTKLLKQGDTVVARARRARRQVPPWFDDETKEFSEYWFGPAQRVQLTRLAEVINALPNSATRNALRVALSRIIVTKSPRASLAADTSHSRPHRVQRTSEFDVYDGFIRSLGVLSAKLERRYITGTAKVARGDSRDLRAVSDATVDLAITSPPYLNAIDYLRGHRLALIWFGHSIAELRRIRSASIGAERSLDNEPSPFVNEVVALIESDAQNAEKLPVPIIERYAQDMARFANEMGRVLKSTDGPEEADGGQATKKARQSKLTGPVPNQPDVPGVQSSTFHTLVELRVCRFMTSLIDESRHR